MPRAKPTVYIETTIISYLVARRSRDIVTAAHQKVTRAWWDERRHGFRLVTSDLVLREASAGDPKRAKGRMNLLSGISRLELYSDAAALARSLVELGPLPEAAGADAVHIAVATCHGIDYLLTWNCKHIANAELRTKIEITCRKAGYTPPILTTPEELMGMSP